MLLLTNMQLGGALPESVTPLWPRLRILLSIGKLWLPAESDATSLPVAELKELGQRGVDHQLIVSVATGDRLQRVQPVLLLLIHPYGITTPKPRSSWCASRYGSAGTSRNGGESSGTMDDCQSRPRKSRVHIWLPAPCHCIYRTGVYRRNSVAQRNL